MKKLVVKMFILIVLCGTYAYAASGNTPAQPPPGTDTKSNSCSANGSGGSICGTGTCPQGTKAQCIGSDVGEPSCHCI